MHRPAGQHLPNLYSFILNVLPVGGGPDSVTALVPLKGVDRKIICLAFITKTGETMFKIVFKKKKQEKRFNIICMKIQLPPKKMLALDFNN